MLKDLLVYGPERNDERTVHVDCRAKCLSADFDTLFIKVGITQWTPQEEVHQHIRVNDGYCIKQFIGNVRQFVMQWAW